MRRLALITIIGLMSSIGCRWNSAQSYQTQPFGQQQVAYQPGYEQTFPPQVQGPAPGQFGQKAGKFLGDMAGGFVRSAVGGAGFSAGRDLWNAIAN